MIAEGGSQLSGKAARRRSLPRLTPHELLIGMVVLSAAFIIGSSSIASGLRSRNQPQALHQVTVTGSAEQAVSSDTLEWDASVASTRPTTSAALAQLMGWASKIRSELDSAGTLDSEVSFGTVVVQPNVQPSGYVSSFTESQTVNVQSHRLVAMRPVLAVGNRLLASNIPFISQAPEYTFSGLKKLRPVLTAEATADARVRARAALGRNGHLGKVISISVGPFSVDAPGSVSIGSGDYDTSSIPKVVSVAVTATYSTS